MDHHSRRVRSATTARNLVAAARFRAVFLRDDRPRRKAVHNSLPWRAWLYRRRSRIRGGPSDCHTRDRAAGREDARRHRLATGDRAATGRRRILGTTAAAGYRCRYRTDRDHVVVVDAVIHAVVGTVAVVAAHIGKANRGDARASGGGSIPDGDADCFSGHRRMGAAGRSATGISTGVAAVVGSGTALVSGDTPAAPFH